MTLNRRSFLTISCATLGAAAWPRLALSQQYPARPVRVIVPFAAGGPTKVENLELRCRCHNQYEAEGFFGPLLVRETRCGYRATPFEPSWSAESRYRGSIERTRE